LTVRKLGPDLAQGASGTWGICLGPARGCRARPGAAEAAGGGPL